MALSQDQLRNIRNNVERNPSRGFAIDYIKSEFSTALDALDDEFEATTKAVFDAKLGAGFSFDAKRLMIKYWLVVKGRDF